MTVMPLAASSGFTVPQMHVLKIPARKVLFEDGDPANHVYEIVSGAVMTYKVLPDGRRQIFEILRPGDFLGFSQVHTYQHGGQTLSKCELRRYPQQSFLATSGNQSRLLSYLIGHRDTHYIHTLVLSRKSAAERIAFFFAEFAGSETGAEGVHINLREMSDYLGLRPETVSRQVNVLCKANLISRSRWGTYRVTDLPGLVALANADQAKDAGENGTWS